MIDIRAKTELGQLLARSKTLLIVFSILLIIANFYLLSATKDLSRSYSDRQNQATWFLFQLSKEFSELIAASRYAHNDAQSLNRTLLKYELTWSRFDLLIDNKEFDTLMSMEGAYEFFIHIFHKYQDLEPTRQMLANADTNREFTHNLDHLYTTMIQFINANFRVKSPVYQSQVAQAKMLNHFQFILMCLLFSCIGLVSYILHKESSYHKQLALIDPLTGVANRLAMMHQTQDRILRGRPFCLYVLDLNGFKGINDTYGHQAGDTVLETLAQRLSHNQNEHDFILYRVGGDEFSIISERTSDSDALFLHKHIHNTFIDPIELDDETQVSMTTSVGYAKYPEHGDNLNQLISVADKKMYQMKFAKR